MNTEQFLYKANQGRLIQWLKSGKIEFIFVDKKKKVLAKNIITGNIHHIVIKNKKNWEVRLVRKDELIKLGNLL